MYKLHNWVILKYTLPHGRRDYLTPYPYLHQTRMRNIFTDMCKCLPLNFISFEPELSYQEASFALPGSSPHPGRIR